MFSKSCEYAIKSMIFISRNSSKGNCISVTSIAEGIDAPKHFIAKILQELSKKRLLQSVKGPNGGFYTNEKDIKASLSDIIKAIDGDKIYSDCVLGLKACSEKKPCPVHFEYKEIKKKLINMIEMNTIESFDEKLETESFFLKNN